MNCAVVIGNLTKDPTLKTTQSGISVCSFTVAVNRGFGDKKDVDYLPVVTWRGLADSCGVYLAKGKKVCVRGRIQTRSYDAKDGSKQYVTEIVADEVDFLSPKSDAEERPVPLAGSGTPNAFDGLEPADDEEVPF